MILMAKEREVICRAVAALKSLEILPFYVPRGSGCVGGSKKNPARGGAELLNARRQDRILAYFVSAL